LVQIHSETSKKQCEFLQKIIIDNKFKKSIEIGFAFGISTLAIIEEVVKNGGNHLVIDKFEKNWNNVGHDLIFQAGYTKYLEFHEEYCYVALPKLLGEGRKFDFAYVDSTKQMDWLLVDFFFLDKILTINGVIVFDDVEFPGVRKLLRYISQFPNYKVYDTYPVSRRSSRWKRAASILKFLPKSNKYLKENILLSDFDLRINSGCVALQKLDETKDIGTGIKNSSAELCLKLGFS
ncbi:MAG: class I SAM-dependent methyltransferase, partial [Chitinophagales bacterium]